jgi:integrase
LKVKDIDIQNGKAYIRRTWSDYTIRETTKQKKKEWIPLSDRAIEIASKNCQGKHPEAWLFINPNSGTTFRPKRLGAIWNEYSGVDIKLYEATRHSFCTQLVEDGVPLPIVKDLARHFRYPDYSAVCPPYR